MKRRGGEEIREKKQVAEGRILQTLVFQGRGLCKKKPKWLQNLNGQSHFIQTLESNLFFSPVKARTKINKKNEGKNMTIVNLFHRNSKGAFTLSVILLSVLQMW